MFSKQLRLSYKHMRLLQWSVRTHNQFFSIETRKIDLFWEIKSKEKKPKQCRSSLKADHMYVILPPKKKNPFNHSEHWIAYSHHFNYQTAGVEMQVRHQKADALVMTMSNLQLWVISNFLVLLYITSAQKHFPTVT